MKVQAQSSSEIPLEYNQDQDFEKPKLIMTFLTNLGVTKRSCSFRLVLEEKTDKEVPDSAGLEFLQTFFSLQKF